MILAARRHQLSPIVHAIDDDGAVCGARPWRGRWVQSTVLPITCPKCLWSLERRFSFCEAARATSSQPLVHIRRLGATGLHRGGGVDTPALCGATVSWDRREEVTPEAVRARVVCASCATAFLESRLRLHLSNAVR